MLLSMQDVKRANEEAGFHWFDSATIRFFKSRVSYQVIPLDDGCVFVSSEKGPDTQRMYSVRRAYDDGRIETVGKFQEYKTPREAWSAAKRFK